ncbi:iron-sulfur cluster assembly scaffold protein NifU [Aliarcobacter trophiarum LMG 25534]|uniref:Nitrogen fixation protein NifU n=1 Tax=Aliarcobacter trophiarum LMG 25534 TaxID=1032241 RepID=A0AAD0QIX9_9BACT|nr:NifU family protein [Aliarcobacter trophiarum]AXK48550.1 [Fe-S] cluster assembly scaffold protein [Aliarcobacter trophiarum LMG 25534]RXI27640.1 iron-sulfur cluster assembly scaffold protein NifU [Aliarcobacter trophiarum]RXJ89948.1 iron-sulfur cluster assembly scaffold protein NifU [Aliarcobacter trophiarum LMG 25534]
MKHYSKKIEERIDNPKHFGEITKEEAKQLGCRLIVADFESNGSDALRVYFAITKDKTVFSAKFKSFATGLIVALDDMMIELCIGKSIEKVANLFKTDVEFALRDEPQTPALGIEELHNGFLNFVILKKVALKLETRDMKDFNDDYVVCECARVSLGTIKDAIKNFDLATIEDIGNITKAGIFCKSCQKEGGLEEKELYLSDILEQTRKEIDEQRQQEPSYLNSSFEDMTKSQKIELIEDVLDDDVRPMLIMDGGNMEILDIVESPPHHDLYIRYLGACSGCSAGSMGTLYAIESILQSKVNENIRVLPI